ncbi:MAG: ABC transporter permease [Candidatus Dormibacteria bacterium]
MGKVAAGGPDIGAAAVRRHHLSALRRRPPGRLRAKLVRLGGGAFGILSAVGAWQLLAFHNPAYLLPSPGEVVGAAIASITSGDLFVNIVTSLGRLGLGLLIGCGIGIPAGLLMGVSPVWNALLRPVVDMLRPVSGIAWIPLGLYLFGFGDAIAVFIAAYVAAWPLLLGSSQGVADMSPDWKRVAGTMGVSRLAILIHVTLPGALPGILTGLRQAVGFVWSAVVAVELIGAPGGVGFAVEHYRTLGELDIVFAYIAVIGILGFAADVIVMEIRRRTVAWADQERLAG